MNVTQNKEKSLLPIYHEAVNFILNNLYILQFGEQLWGLLLAEVWPKAQHLHETSDISHAITACSKQEAHGLKWSNE